MSEERFDRLTCPDCRHRAPVLANFCPQCGRSLAMKVGDITVKVDAGLRRNELRAYQGERLVWWRPG